MVVEESENHDSCSEELNDTNPPNVIEQQGRLRENMVMASKCSGRSER